jgi:hypothetical protein
VVLGAVYLLYREWRREKIDIDYAFGGRRRAAAHWPDTAGGRARVGRGRLGRSDDRGPEGDGPPHDRAGAPTGGAREPGARLRIETELNIGDVLHSLDDEFDAAMVRLPFVNPVTGPVYIEGARPDHVLVCDIEDIELVPPGFTALVPGFGPFVD